METKSNSVIKNLLIAIIASCLVLIYSNYIVALNWLLYSFQIVVIGTSMALAFSDSRVNKVLPSSNFYRVGLCIITLAFLFLLFFVVPLETTKTGISYLYFAMWPFLIATIYAVVLKYIFELSRVLISMIITSVVMGTGSVVMNAYEFSLEEIFGFMTFIYIFLFPSIVFIKSRAS